MAVFGKSSKDKKQRPPAQPVPKARQGSGRPYINAAPAASASYLPRHDAQGFSGTLMHMSQPQPITHISRHPNNFGPYPATYQLPNQPANPYPSNGNHAWASTNNLAAQAAYQTPYQQSHTIQHHMSYSQPHLPLPGHGTQQPPNAGRLNQGAALVDRIQDRMSVIITAMDDNNDDPQLMLEDDLSPPTTTTRGPVNESHRRIHSAPIIQSMGTTYFSKVWLYANSRLPPHLPPFKVYVPTYPILCLAARYSLSAYKTSASNLDPQSSLSSTTPIHIPPSLRLGTKAMTLAMQTLDTSNTIVLAIRGSATFADWAVNFRPSPDSPAGFLDDPGNLVHSGFLAVAKAMVAPIAERLRRIFQDDPDKWKGASLLLTGHSAGGAVASLLFCHLLSQSASVRSELKDLAGLLRRAHCITFGAPPVSLLPLQKPTAATVAAQQQEEPAAGESRETSRWRKSMFFAFVNEGDPVVRADRAFVRSLLALYTTPAPVPPKPSAVAGAVAPPRPVWKVPANNLSNAGRLVVLRPRASGRVKKRTRFFGVGAESGGDSNAAGKIEKIEAVLTTDAQLRTVVFGDPAVHSMKLYSRRIETLAVNAVTGNSY